LPALDHDLRHSTFPPVAAIHDVVSIGSMQRAARAA
jgi:hypothetical protein